MIKDVRFVQRFNNFLKAFEHFESAVKLAKKRQLSDLEKQGLIKSFEFTHELFWKVLEPV
jgi:molecular chaperone GrpE (heat shock protein)